MDDIKLYASKKNHILSLLTIIENFSNDIGMSFGIDKCKTQSICRGHYENLEYITQEGEIIKNLNKGEFYKYRASHIRLISEFILYATKNTNDDHLIPFIM
jgi:ferredoxin-fold anticodon binding domain-containing protein